MSSSSDNPFVRFTAFWWALGVFSLFGVILLVMKLFTSGSSGTDPLEEAAAVKRYETRSAVDAAQAAALGYKEVEKGKTVQVPPSVAFEHVGKTLLGSKPVAVETDAQIVPGGPVALRKASEKGPDLDAVDKLTPPAGTAPDPAAMEAGKAIFMSAACMGCHGMNGEGMPMVGPPLADSEWVKGPVSNLIRIQLRGLEGPITVHGKQMTFLAPMAAVMAPEKDDAKVASVLTYIRNSFGNSAPPVLPEQVKMLRSETGKPALKEADLIKP